MKKAMAMAIVTSIEVALLSIPTFAREATETAKPGFFAPVEEVLCNAEDETKEVGEVIAEGAFQISNGIKHKIGNGLLWYSDFAATVSYWTRTTGKFLRKPYIFRLGEIFTCDVFCGGIGLRQ